MRSPSQDGTAVSDQSWALNAWSAELSPRGRKAIERQWVRARLAYKDQDPQVAAALYFVKSLHIHILLNLTEMGSWEIS